MLEALADGRYYWIPFQRIQTIVLEKPADLRDYVWMPAQFTWANGGETVGLIPAVIRIRRLASIRWCNWGARPSGGKCDAETWLGLGQRMLTTDQGEYPLLDARRIDLKIETILTDAESGDG